MDSNQKEDFGDKMMIGDLVVDFEGDEGVIAKIEGDQIWISPYNDCLWGPYRASALSLADDPD